MDKSKIVNFLNKRNIINKLNKISFSLIKIKSLFENLNKYG